MLLAADQVSAAEHVAPLVVAAHLQPAAVALEQLQEVVGLHQHVRELQERQAVVRRHARLIAFGRQHLVDGEKRADVAHEVDEVQVTQPVAVVDDDGLVLREVEEPAHLLPDARDVAVDRFHGHHLAHVRLAGRVANHGGTAAHQGDGTVSGALHVRHGHDRNVVADVQGVGCRIETDVECGGVFKLLVELVFKRHLSDEAAFPQQVENVLSHGKALRFQFRPPLLCAGRNGGLQKNAFPNNIGKA